MSICIHIEKFSGPLGLLLYLIRKEEMDIFDIDIYPITKQYLNYIKQMKLLDLEVAGDFIAMAATLMQIKSRMLLPQYDEDGDEVEDLDPRKELVQKLLDYQLYKEAGEEIYNRSLLGRDQWARGSRIEFSHDKAQEEILLEDNALFSLIRCYRKSMKSMKKAVHKVMGELQSIAERILELSASLKPQETVTFSSLVQDSKDGLDKKNHLLITFLSFLELTKLGFVSLFQTENFSEIHITTKEAVTNDVITKVENYSNFSEEPKLAVQWPETHNTPQSFIEDEPLEIEAATDKDISEEELRILEENRHSKKEDTYEH